jgi:hypothetical protein
MLSNNQCAFVNLHCISIDSGGGSSAITADRCPPRGDALGGRSLPDRPPLRGTTARDALVATSAPTTGDGHVRTLTTRVPPRRPKSEINLT